MMLRIFLHFFPVGSENSLGYGSVRCIGEYPDEAVALSFALERRSCSFIIIGRGGFLDILCFIRILQCFKCLIEFLIFHNFFVGVLKMLILLCFHLFFNTWLFNRFHALLFGWSLLNGLFRFLGSFILFLYFLFQWFFIFIGLVGFLFSASCDVDTD